MLQTVMDILDFGRIPGTDTVAKLFRIENSEGTVLSVSDYGATVTSLIMKGKSGVSDELLCGYNECAPYLSANMYSGATVGRVCNRIRAGEFQLNGNTYRLSVNEGSNHLHGGIPGFHARLWRAEAFSNGKGVRFSLLSEDGEAGYPGNLMVHLDISLREGNVLRFSYEAETDRATPVNLTNHAYWNLSGRATILDHRLEIPSSRVLEVDDALIPTGNYLHVQGTALDFSEMKALGKDIASLQETALGGYDHCYVVEGWKGDKRLRRAARLYDPVSARCMEVYTDCPGIQLYTGNSMAGQENRDKGTWGAHQALCLETEFFPDSVHHAHFPSVILEPGAPYVSVSEYRLSLLTH